MKKDRNQMSVTEIIDDLMSPGMEFLFKNYKNPEALNSCLDIAGDNLRTLNAISEQCKKYIKDYEKFRSLTLEAEKRRKAQSESTGEEEENSNS